MTSVNQTSPFHPGEQAIQTRTGTRERSEKIGQRAIRDHLPDQHREFYAQLPYVFLGALDHGGQPWASMLIGRPGFMSSPDPRSLEIRTKLVDGDPLHGQFGAGASVGLLGIEYETRRRNRLSARVIDTDHTHIALHIEQSFGNCPQYIQARGLTLLDGIDVIGEPRERDDFTEFNTGAHELIESSDNFYIASHHTENMDAVSNGADVSHRGGEPGFVKLLDKRTLQFPDYPGNNHFNTFGNLLLSPRAGLTFVDFLSGDLLFLTGSAEIIWDGPEVAAIPGAQRLVRFTLAQGRRVANAAPIQWEFLNYSPRLLQLKS
jgi:hypothetical protein